MTAIPGIPHPYTLKNCSSIIIFSMVTDLLGMVLYTISDVDALRSVTKHETKFTPSQSIGIL